MVGLKEQMMNMMHAQPALKTIMRKTMTVVHSNSNIHESESSIFFTRICHIGRSESVSDYDKTLFTEAYARKHTSPSVIRL